MASAFRFLTGHLITVKCRALFLCWPKCFRTKPQFTNPTRGLKVNLRPLSCVKSLSSTAHLEHFVRLIYHISKKFSSADLLLLSRIGDDDIAFVHSGRRELQLSWGMRQSHGVSLVKILRVKKRRPLPFLSHSLMYLSRQVSINFGRTDSGFLRYQFASMRS
jgi:hypothetical protein